MRWLLSLASSPLGALNRDSPGVGTVCGVCRESLVKIIGDVRGRGIKKLER